MPKPNGDIDLEGSEVEGEHNCSKWNVFQSVQDIFVSFKNTLGVQCHRVVFARLRRLDLVPELSGIIIAHVLAASRF